MKPMSPAAASAPGRAACAGCPSRLGMNSSAAVPRKYHALSSVETASTASAAAACLPPAKSASCANSSLVMKTLSSGMPTRLAAPSVKAEAASGLR